GPRGRHQHDRADRGRPGPPDPLVPQAQLLRRPNEQSEPVVGQGGLVEFKGGLRSAAHRLQADPPQPVAPRGRLEWDGLEPVQGPERVAVYRFLLWHQLRLRDVSGRGCRLIVRSSAGPAAPWRPTPCREAARSWGGNPWAVFVNPTAPL